MLQLTDIALATNAARQRRPDLPMVGVSVGKGVMRVHYFPTWETDIAPEPVVLASGLSLPAAYAYLQNL